MYSYQQTFPTDPFGNRYVGNDMGKYTESLPEAPKNIESRHAILVGGGIGNLIAAGYLLRDAQMPGENITILEQRDIAGGSFDGAGDNEHGFIARGGREMGQHFECFWDIMKDVPARDMPAPHSVLDEFRTVNEADPNISNCRIISDQARTRLQAPDMGLSKKAQFQIVKLRCQGGSDLLQDDRGLVRPGLHQLELLHPVALHVRVPELPVPDRDEALHAPVPSIPSRFP